jgi:hypothetical protein
MRSARRTPSNIFIFKIYGLIPRRSAAVKAVEKRSEKL